MKIGLEIHFQLNGSKLFCSCSTEGKDTKDYFRRKLTPVMGEMGRVDTAVEYETIRNRDFLYRISTNSCLVENDEDPPHFADLNALKTALAISKALNCNILDYVSFMRKIVVDGSNTSGFQRTGVISMDGRVKTSRGDVRISAITLEEDACRKMSEKNDVVEYSLDRLGVPLIEISTEPDIVDPDHAMETAKAIGHYVMSMPNFRGEVDSIRQDVNFSMGFGRVEIKGVSKLSFIKDTIEYEIKRQSSLKEISDILSEKSPEIGDFIDITDIFGNTDSSMVKKSIASGKSVLCAKVSKCHGFMKHGNYKLGREFADVARNIGLGGLMHSDEFPAYGITEEELNAMYSTVGKRHDDAVIVVLGSKSDIAKLKPLLDERLLKIMKMKLEETRSATPSGETRYLRPLAGKERMYPETDVPLVEITESLLVDVREMIPKPVEEKIAELTQKFGLSSVEAESIINNNLLSLYEALVKDYNDPHLLARVLLQTIPEMEKKIGRKLNQNEMADILGKPYTEANGIPLPAIDKIISIMGIAKKNHWDRNTMETALSMYLLDQVAVDKLETRDELNMLDHIEITNILKEMISEQDVTERNLIYLFKKKTKRSFNPSDVIKIFREIKFKK